MIDRREFIKSGFAVGISAITGAVSLPSVVFGNPDRAKLDISVVNGDNYFDSTLKAVETLGGIGKFVTKGSKVGLLINSPWDKPGTYTNPDIALAVLKMCLEADVKEIYSLEDASADYWKRSKLHKKMEKVIGLIKSPESSTTVNIARGKSLKQAGISKTLLECDVFINIPIVKNHEGTQFTANLKNMMGACSGTTNRFFHKGSGKGGPFSFYSDVEFLSQCIADVNLIRQPNLSIVDATEFVINNGPAGPGELKKARQVIAGTNCVSVDAFCAALLGLKPADVLMIRYAGEHGLGEIDLKKLAIKEI